MALKYYNTGSSTGFGSYATAGNWWTGSGRSGSSGTLPGACDAVILESNICTLGGCTPSLSSICNQQSGTYAGGKTLCVDGTINLFCTGTSVFNNNSVICLANNANAKIQQCCGTMTLSGSCIMGSFNTSNGCLNGGANATFCVINSLLSGGNYSSGGTASTFFTNATACGNILYSNVNCSVWCNSYNYTPLCIGNNNTGFKYTCFINSTNYASVTGCSSYTTGPSFCFFNNSVNNGCINAIGSTYGQQCFSNSTNNGNLKGCYITFAGPNSINNGNITSCTCSLFLSGATNNNGVLCTTAAIFSSNAVDYSNTCVNCAIYCLGSINCWITCASTCVLFLSSINGTSNGQIYAPNVYFCNNSCNYQGSVYATSTTVLSACSCSVCGTICAPTITVALSSFSTNNNTLSGTTITFNNSSGSDATSCVSNGSGNAAVLFCNYSFNCGNVDNSACFICNSNNYGTTNYLYYGTSTVYNLYNYNSNNNGNINLACKTVFCNNSFNNSTVNPSNPSTGTGTVYFYDTSYNNGTIQDGYNYSCVYFLGNTSYNQGTINTSGSVYFCGIGSSSTGGNCGTICNTCCVLFCASDNNGCILGGGNSTVCFANGSSVYGSNNNCIICFSGNNSIVRFGSSTSNTSSSVNYCSVIITGCVLFLGSATSNQGTVDSLYGNGGVAAIFCNACNAGIVNNGFNNCFLGSTGAVNTGTVTGCTCFIQPAWNCGTVCGDTFFTGTSFSCSQYYCSLCNNNCHVGNICFGFAGPLIAFPSNSNYAQYQFWVNMTPGYNYLDCNGALFSCICTNSCCMIILGNTLNNRNLQCLILKGDDAICGVSYGNPTCVYLNYCSPPSTIVLCCGNQSTIGAAYISGPATIISCVICYQPGTLNCLPGNAYVCGTNYNTGYDCVTICSPSINFYSSGTSGASGSWVGSQFSPLLLPNMGIVTDNFNRPYSQNYGPTRYVGTINIYSNTISNSTGNTICTLQNFTNSVYGFNLNLSGTLTNGTNTINCLILSNGDSYLCHTNNNTVSAIFACNGSNIRTDILGSCSGTAYVCLYDTSYICGNTVISATFVNNLTSNPSSYQNGFTTLSALQYCLSNTSISSICFNNGCFAVNAKGAILDTYSNPITRFLFTSGSCNIGTISSATSAYIYDTSCNKGNILGSGIFYGKSANNGCVCTAIFNNCSYNGCGGTYTKLTYNSLQKGISGTSILGPVYNFKY